MKSDQPNPEVTIQAILEKERTTGKNPANDWEVLGLQHGTASKSQIKAAYRRASLMFHPDKNMHNVEDATKAFQRVIPLDMSFLFSCHQRKSLTVHFF